MTVKCAYFTVLKKRRHLDDDDDDTHLKCRRRRGCCHQSGFEIISIWNVPRSQSMAIRSAFLNLDYSGTRCVPRSILFADISLPNLECHLCDIHQLLYIFDKCWGSKKLSYVSVQKLLICTMLVKLTLWRRRKEQLRKIHQKAIL